MNVPKGTIVLVGGLEEEKVCGGRMILLGERQSSAISANTEDIEILKGLNGRDCSG